jgi:glyoxylase-like metal-dependent hydrolase (beta-lactamase superfamily II)
MAQGLLYSTIANLERAKGDHSMSQLAETRTETAVTPEVTPFFDEPTNTLTYVVRDHSSKACAVVDSVMDLDYPSGSITFDSANQVIQYIRDNNLELEWILETHVHADHLSAAPYIQNRLGGKIAIGFNISVVQETFGKVFNAGAEFARDGSQFDVLLEDGDSIQIGNMSGYAMHTPGHTPACMTYILGDAVFVGDTLFMPDGGTARVDFPGGDAATLYQSIHRILSLPEEYRIFVCHDYLPDGRELEYETTVAAQLESNIHVHRGIGESAFAEMRNARDATLGMPKLIMPSLQVNMRAGHMPLADDNGRVYFRLPINAFGGDDISELL